MSIFKGSTAMCVTHLSKVPGEGTAEKREKIANFAGVGGPTVGRWFRGTMPVGEALIRLRFYLEFLDYDVEELGLLLPPIREAGRLFAFRVASLAEVAAFIGYPANRNGLDGVIAALRGDRGVSQERLQNFVSFVDTHSAQLLEKQQATPKVTITGGKHDHRTHAPRPRETAIAVPPLHRPDFQGPLQNHEAVIESLAGLVKALIPLVELVSSDEFTAEERARFRELAGNGAFTFTNLLYRLCGERSRTIHAR